MFWSSSLSSCSFIFEVLACELSNATDACCQRYQINYPNTSYCSGKTEGRTIVSDPFIKGTMEWRGLIRKSRYVKGYILLRQAFMLDTKNIKAIKISEMSFREDVHDDASGSNSMCINVVDSDRLPVNILILISKVNTGDPFPYGLNFTELLQRTSFR